VLTFLRLLLETFGPTVGWIGVLAAVVVSAFVIYVGVTLGVALFHSDEKVRRHAAVILRQLLSLFARERRR